MTDDKTAVQGGTRTLFIPLVLLIGGGIAFGNDFKTFGRVRSRACTASGHHFLGHRWYSVADLGIRLRPQQRAAV